MPRPRTVHTLHKLSYRIFKKMHDLERPRKASRIYAEVLDGTPAIVACISHLESLLQNSLTKARTDKCAYMIDSYFKNIEQLKELTEVCASKQQKLSKGPRAKVLRSHTRLFRFVRKIKFEPELDEEEWQKVVTISVLIWGNQLS